MRFKLATTAFSTILISGCLFLERTSIGVYCSKVESVQQIAAAAIKFLLTSNSVSAISLSLADAYHCKQIYAFLYQLVEL